MRDDDPGTRTSTSADWNNTILAGLANYIDAGSIVSGSAALALWAVAYDLSPEVHRLAGRVQRERHLGRRRRARRRPAVRHLRPQADLPVRHAVLCIRHALAGVRHSTVDDRRRIHPGRPGGGRGHSGVVVSDRRDGAGARARKAQRRRAGPLVSGPGRGAGDVPGSRAAGCARRPHRVRAPRARGRGAHAAAAPNEGVCPVGERAEQEHGRWSTSPTLD